MEIAIENYQCYYRRVDGDASRYQYEVLWDDAIASYSELNEVVRMLRSTYKDEQKRRKPIAIAVFTCPEERTIEELAKEL